MNCHYFKKYSLGKRCIPIQNKTDWHDLFISSFNKQKWKINREYHLHTTRIDIVIEKIRSDEKNNNADIFDDYFSKTNIIEYKSSWESLTIKEVYKTIGKYMLFLSETQNDIKNTGLFFIITHYPNKLLNTDFFKSIKIIQTEPGVLLLKHIMGNASVYIIVINRLKFESRTANLLKFSSGNTKQRFIKFLLDNINDEKYAEFLVECYILDPQEIIKVSDGKVLQLVSVNDNIRYAIETIGIKKVIDAVGLEKVIDAVGLEKIVKSGLFGKLINKLGIEELYNIIIDEYREGKITKENLQLLKNLLENILEEN